MCACGGPLFVPPPVDGAPAKAAAALPHRILLVEAVGLVVAVRLGALVGLMTWIALTVAVGGIVAVAPGALVALVALVESVARIVAVAAGNSVSALVGEATGVALGGRGMTTSPVVRFIFLVASSFPLPRAVMMREIVAKTKCASRNRCLWIFL